MRNRARKNYVIYVLMLLLFGGLIYAAIEEGDRFSHYAINAHNTGRPFQSISSIYTGQYSSSALHLVDSDYSRIGDGASFWLFI